MKIVSKSEVKEEANASAILADQNCPVVGDNSSVDSNINKSEEPEPKPKTDLVTPALTDPLCAALGLDHTKDVGSQAAEVASTESSMAGFCQSLTQQVLGRQPPIIASTAVDRGFLLRLSQLPWSEQRKLKAAYDQALNCKRPKKPVVPPSEELYQQQAGGKPLPDPLRQGPLPTKLELRQVSVQLQGIIVCFIHAKVKKIL